MRVPGSFALSAAARAYEAIELKCHPERIDPEEDFDLPQRVRSYLAKIIGSDENEIVLTSGTTHAVAMVPVGLHFKPSDEVIVSDGNFPFNIFHLASHSPARCASANVEK